MIRLILALTAILASAVPATGQSLRFFGALGGAAATMTGDIEDDLSLSHRYGLAATVGVERALTNLIGLQARVGYIQKGFQASAHDDLLGTVETYFARGYVDFSALGRIGDGPVHAFLGTSVGLPVSCEIGGTLSGITFSADCSDDDVDVTLATDVGLTVGIGTARLWKGMFANLLFTEGLRDAGAGGEDIADRNRSLHLVIGTSLGGGGGR